MDMTRCQACWSTIEDDTRRCPHCGTPTRRSSSRPALVAALAILAVAGGVATWIWAGPHRDRGCDRGGRHDRDRSAPDTRARRRGGRRRRSPRAASPHTGIGPADDRGRARGSGIGCRGCGTGTAAVPRVARDPPARNSAARGAQAHARGRARRSRPGLHDLEAGRPLERRTAGSTSPGAVGQRLTRPVGVRRRQRTRDARRGTWSGRADPPRGWRSPRRRDPAPGWLRRARPRPAQRRGSARRPRCRMVATPPVRGSASPRRPAGAAACHRPDGPARRRKRHARGPRSRRGDPAWCSGLGRTRAGPVVRRRADRSGAAHRDRPRAAARPGPGSRSFRRSLGSRRPDAERPSADPRGARRRLDRIDGSGVRHGARAQPLRAEPTRRFAAPTRERFTKPSWRACSPSWTTTLSAAAPRWTAL